MPVSISTVHNWYIFNVIISGTSVALIAMQQLFLSTALMTRIEKGVSFETLIAICQTTRRHIAEDSYLHNHHCRRNINVKEPLTRSCHLSDYILTLNSSVAPFWHLSAMQGLTQTKTFRVLFSTPVTILLLHATVISEEASFKLQIHLFSEEHIAYIFRVVE
jgi:hypothetical protein